MRLPKFKLPQRATTTRPDAMTTLLEQDTLRPFAPHLYTEPRTDPIALADMPTRPGWEETQKVVARRGTQPFTFSVGWNAGLTRMHAPNEDSVAVVQGVCTHLGRLLPFGLLVVADGMGGHACGLEASRLAIQCMLQVVMQNMLAGNEVSDEFFSELMIEAAACANESVYEHGQVDEQDMGTTLTAALVVNQKAYIVNVGDSRTYLYRESAGLIQITRDHSLVASLVAFGQITPDEVYTHPDRNKVYRSLGQLDDVKVDLFVIDVRPQDCLLLCSDGLWEMVRDPAIERVIRSSESVQRVSERLVHAALQGGGVDNISAVVARL